MVMEGKKNNNEHFEKKTMFKYRIDPQTEKKGDWIWKAFMKDAAAI
jgi:hypothetical protein